MQKRFALLIGRTVRSWEKKNAVAVATARLVFATYQKVDVFVEEIGNFTKIRQRDFSLAKQVAGDGLLRNIHFSGEFRDAHFPH